MKLEFDIRDDAELRKYIRECIKGEITHIIREEISDMIVALIGKEKDRFTVTRAENMMAAQITKAVKMAVNEGAHDDHKKVDKEIKAQVAAEILTRKEFIDEKISIMVDGLIDEDIREEIKKQISKTTHDILARTFDGLGDKK